MKLNPDCTRDVLIAIEDTVDLCTSFQCTAENTHERLKAYPHNVVAYHIHHCDLAGLLVGCSICGNGAMVIVEDLSPAGHEFLANTRKNPVWEKVKEIGDEIGSDSTKSLAEIATQIVLQQIRKKFSII